MSKLNKVLNYFLPVLSVLCVLGLWWWAAAVNENLASPVETANGLYSY